MKNNSIRVLKKFIIIFGLIITIFLGMLLYKSNSIYQEAWKGETFQTIDWTQYSDEFKTISLSELDQRNVDIIFSNLTMRRYLKNEKTKIIEFNLLGFITYLYCKIFVPTDKAIPKILNYSSLGSNLVSFSSAAIFYVGKNIKEINLSESALLFAISKSPNRYNPFMHLNYAYQGRNGVLSNLRKNTNLSIDIINMSISEPINLRTQLR